MRSVPMLLFAVAGCAPSSLSRTSEPASPKSTVAAPAEKPKEAVAQPLPPPPVVDKTPIVADVSKAKFDKDDGNLFGYNEGDNRAFLYTNGTAEVTVKVPADGDYDIVLTLSCDEALNEFAKFKVYVDGKQAGRELSCTTTEPKEYRLSARIAAGDRRIGVEFTNDVYKEGEYDRNLYVNGVQLVRSN